MRIDRLLCYLRFCRTRSRAAGLVAEGHMRRNGERVTRPSQPVEIGDVLTIPVGKAVRLAEILALPERRGSPREAQACYRLLEPGAGRTIDQAGESAIAPRRDQKSEGDLRT